MTISVGPAMSPVSNPYGAQLELLSNGPDLGLSCGMLGPSCAEVGARGGARWAAVGAVLATVSRCCCHVGSKRCIWPTRGRSPNRAKRLGDGRGGWGWHGCDRQGVWRSWDMQSNQFSPYYHACQASTHLTSQWPFVDQSWFLLVLHEKSVAFTKRAGGRVCIYICYKML